MPPRFCAAWSIMMGFAAVPSTPTAVLNRAISRLVREAVEPGGVPPTQLVPELKFGDVVPVSSQLIVAARAVSEKGAAIIPKAAKAAATGRAVSLRSRNRRPDTNV